MGLGTRGVGKIKAILWDFGGVLVRTEDRCPRTMLADMLGITYSQLENLVFNSESGKAAQLGKITPEDNWERFRVQFNLRADEIPAIQTAFFGGDVLDRELVDFIQTLKKTYDIGLLSNYSINLRTELQDKWGILEIFDHITLSSEVGVMKPEAGIYLKALEEASAEPNEAVFIDDFPHNVQGATAIGMVGLLFQGRDQIIRDLHQVLQNHENPP